MKYTIAALLLILSFAGECQEKLPVGTHPNPLRTDDFRGLTSFLTKMHDKNLIASLATMNDTPSIDLVIDALNIRTFFHSITNGHEIRQGKTDPEIYQIALEKLALKSTECIVIEDSIGDITSARQAGIEVIGITTSHTENELVENGCLLQFQILMS